VAAQASSVLSCAVRGVLVLISGAPFARLSGGQNTRELFFAYPR
jgi:hypothetical protein